MTVISSDEARQLSELLRLFGQPQRLQILSLLLQGGCAVSEIETRLNIGQPALSQQLAALRKAGVISARRESRAIYYNFTDETEAQRFRVLFSLLNPGAASPTAMPMRTSVQGKAPHAGVTHSGIRKDFGAQFARLCPPPS
jgi:DNA-binding transcriptional ArsR family regulator